MTRLKKVLAPNSILRFAKNLFRLIAIGIFFATSAQAASQSDWDILLDEGDGKFIQFGVALEEHGLGYSRFVENRFSPASVAKLFTAAAALEVLGPEYRFETKLTWQQNPQGFARALSIEANGDPSWGLPEIGEDAYARVRYFARILKESGVANVIGGLKWIQRSNWQNGSNPPGWEVHDSKYCYGARATDVNFQLNCASYQIISVNSGQWLDAGLSDVRVAVSLQAGKVTELNWHQIGENQIQVNGTIAEKDLPYQLNIPRQDVRLQLGSLFNEALASEGIQIKNSRDDQSWSQREAVFYSVPLRDLLKPLLKNSINLLGDSLAKAIGQKLKPGSQDVHSAGVEFILAFAVRESQDSRTELFDGSGMSRRSSVSPRGMISYLQALLSKPYFPEIWNALSVAGVDGTLTSRMKGTIAEGFVRGKTGTLRGSYTIAGYIPKLGQLVPYVLLAKTDAKFSGAARLIQDRFLIRASHTYRGPFSPLPVGEYGVDPFPYYPDHAGLDGEN